MKTDEATVTSERRKPRGGGSGCQGVPDGLHWSSRVAAAQPASNSNLSTFVHFLGLGVAHTGHHQRPWVTRIPSNQHQALRFRGIRNA